MERKLEAFKRLLDTMDELREQCPWDRKQTMESLRPHTIEETYELADAILEGSPELIREELGDLILHIVFYARIASEQQTFDIADVCHGIVDKLIKRHPHIYGDVKVNNEEEVKRNWEQIKLKEKKNKATLEGVPSSLPSLVKAIRLQEKASGVGFDWDDRASVWNKVREEMEEFREMAETPDKNHQKIEEEYGDMLFALINYARFIDVNPENALEKTNLKFMKRFNYIEQRVREVGRNLKEISLDEMEGYWQEAKKLETDKKL